MIIKNETIKSASISLDGDTFYKCHFIKCNLIYSGLLPVGLKDCVFEECRWSFSGAAKNTIGFMKGLHNLGDGSSNVIEDVFNQIRKGTSNSTDSSNMN